MEERIVFMQEEDGMATFERENGETIIYPIVIVPEEYKQGDIIKAEVYADNILFLGIDREEMERRSKRINEIKKKLRKRINNNKA